MAKKKVCVQCKLFVDGPQCPKCKGHKFSTNWQGRINILDAKNSVIAQKVGIDQKGEYTIKHR